MRDINEVLREECQQTWHFGEILGDVLSEKNFTQSEFARQMNYTETVVSRLINAPRVPRWIDYREIQRITRCVECSNEQIGMLIAAFICDMIRDRGLIQ